MSFGNIILSLGEQHLHSGRTKPVGGALTGLTRCELLRLLLRHIIRFYFLQNFDRPLCLQHFSGYPVSWAQAIRLSRNKTSVFTWGSIRMLPEGEQMLKKGTSPTPSSHGGEADDKGKAVHDLRDDVDSLEERLSQMGAPSRMPFWFMQSSQLPSKWSLTPEHQQDHSMPKDQMHYCIHIRVTLGEGRNQPPPSHAWSGSLIADMFQEGLEEQITKAVVLGPGEAILFFGW